MKKPSNRLGRGLDAIFGDVEKAYSQNLSPEQIAEQISHIPLSQINPNPYQPRKKFHENDLQELAQSITEHGLLQPIIVFLPDPKKPDFFYIIAGERRFRASKIAGKEKIKAIIVDPKTVDPNFTRLRELALIENIQRKNLNAIELALSYQEMLRTQNLTHEKLAEKIKKSRASITNTLRLLGLNETIRDAILDEKISEAHAKILAGLPENEQNALFFRILDENLSVKDTAAQKKITKSSKSPHPALKNIVEALKNLQFSAKIRENGVFISLPTEKKLQDFAKILGEKC